MRSTATRAEEKVFCYNLYDVMMFLFQSNDNEMFDCRDKRKGSKEVTADKDSLNIWDNSL